MPSDTRAIALIAAIIIVAVTEVGFAYGKRHADTLGDDASVAATLAAAFGIVALLIGFSFSLSVSRYDARRTTVVNEANAIGTTILRAQLLDPSEASALRSKLRAYVDARIAFSQAGADAVRRAVAGKRSAELQRDLWNLAMVAARRNPRSTLVPLFVQALNQMIDVSGEQAAALAAVIPETILIVLFVVVLVAALLLGLDFGRKGRPARIPAVLFAVMLGLVIGVIVDMDRPQHGLIRIPLDPLTQLKQLF